MDIHCTTCGEPWDVHHLRHDVIHETDLDEQEIEVWRQLRRNDRLSPWYREKLTAIGYEFGASLFDVRRCPCCPKGAKPDPTKVRLKSALTDLLGDDEDGLAALMEDSGL